MKWLTVGVLDQTPRQGRLLGAALKCVECGIEAPRFIHFRMNPKSNNAIPLGGTYCPGCALVHLDETLDAYRECVTGVSLDA